jgi:hypothetical protein
MGRAGKALAVAFGLGGLLLASGLFTAAPAAAQDGGGGQPRVTICHREGDGTFHEITVAAPSLPAHAAHGDIIPAPAGGCPTTTGGGTGGGGTGGGTTRVTICHREGNGTFHEITVDDNAVPAHLAHGDIVPVPPGGCPTAPPPPPPVVGGVGGSVGGGGVVANRPAVRPAPPVAPAATPAPPTVVSGAAAPPVPVAELPRTGARAVGIELAMAAGLFLLGGLLLKGSAVVGASAAPEGAPGGSLFPIFPGLPILPVFPVFSIEEDGSPTSPVQVQTPRRRLPVALLRPHRPTDRWSDAPPMARAGPSRRRRSRAP